MNFEFSVIIYILTVVLLIVLICLGIKLIHTLYKVDKVVDEANDKIGKLDNLFAIIDTTSDTIARLNEYVIGGVSKFVGTLFRVKKNRKKEEKNG